MTTTNKLGVASLVLGISLWLCWMSQAFGVVGSAIGVGRWLAVLFVIVLVTFAIAVVRESRHSFDGDRKLTMLVVLLLVTLSLAVRLVGADHEVGERAYQDEGTYYHHAQEINTGKPWRWSFVYGHVSYYAGAFGLWLASLSPSLFSSVASLWSGTAEPLAHEWLVLRFLVALLSALTVLPVFGIAWHIAAGFRAELPDAKVPERPDFQLAAAAVAGLLYIFSPVFNEGSHLIISDYPSACLATFALYFVARLAMPGSEVPGTTESAARASVLRDYALAGAFSGLAAATKYPAGTVVVAIVAVFIANCWLIRKRDQRSAVSTEVRVQFSDQVLGLLTASATSIALFLVSMPTFVLNPQQAIFAPRGMLFGLRQYSKGGWIGVMPESQFAYYWNLTTEAVGWVALIALFIGPFLLTKTIRHRWLTLAIYPGVYLGLLLTMNMVVKRNLAPAIPILAALAGVVLVGLAHWMSLRQDRVSWPRLLTAVAVIALFSPAWQTVQQTVGLGRSSTREVALRWMVDNLPQGTRVFRESYTPKLPPEHFFLRRARFAARVPIEEIEADRYEYVVLAGNAFGRFLDPEAHTEPHHAVMAQRYKEMFDRYQEVRRFEPGKWRRGPTLWLLKVIPRDAGATSSINDA